MISILFIIPTLDKGGAENVLLNLVNNMNHNKYEITVQTLFDHDSQRSLLHHSVKYKSFMKKPFRGNSRLFARFPAAWLYKHIVIEKYDIVVSYLEGPTAHILSGCPYPDTKTVAWIHTAFDTDRGFYAGFNSKNEAIEAYRNYDKIAFVAQTAKRRFAEIAECDFSQSVVLYNTIESEKIILRSTEAITDKPFNNAEINLISVGKLQPVKGYDRLIRVHKRLIDDGFKIHTYLIGQGEQQSELQDYIQQNKLQGSFTLLGFKENPYPYVARADLFVCSSRREGFSTAVTESLILETPVVTTDCSGMRELLGENDNYGIITENNEDGLYEGVKKMLASSGLLAHYKVMAKERAKDFSTEKTVSAVEAMLNELMKENED